MKDDTITLDHGSGGKIAHQFTEQMLVPLFDNPMLSQLDDGAVFEVGGWRLAFSTDSHVVDPIFFPGGSIGDLAVNGTVNDVSMCGALPLYLSVGLIIEEGFPMDDLKRVTGDMARAAKTAGVTIVTGDTKVVPKGAADKIFINTAGIGLIPEGVNVGGRMARPGDHVLLSGTLADHGVTVLTQREELGFDLEVASDTAPLNRMVQQMLKVCPDVHVLRDPTRGGLGTTLNEIAGQAGVSIRIHEDRIPIRKAVAGLCEMLGFDPLYLANEGKLIAIVPERHSEAVLDAMRKDPAGGRACCIGEVTDESPGKVFMTTAIGGSRIVDMLTGEQLPRIC